MNKTEFVTIFQPICTLYRVECTKSLMSIYYDILADLSKQQFAEAAKHIISNRKYSTLPLPADFLEATTGDIDTQALLALVTLENAMRSVGSYKSVRFKDETINAVIAAAIDGGWVSLCLTPLQTWQHSKQEFLKLYKAFKSKNIKSKTHLAGVLEKTNGYSEEYLVEVEDYNNKKGSQWKMITKENLMIT